MNSKQKGDISESVVLAHLVKKGLAVAIPFGNNHRFDLLVELDGVFKRVQVKTGRIRSGSLEFNTTSVNGVTGARTQYSEKEIDLFLIYCPENGKIYRFPAGSTG